LDISRGILNKSIIPMHGEEKGYIDNF